MKKVKAMTEEKPQPTNSAAPAPTAKRPAHITLVKPAPTILGKDPGACRPT